MKSFFRKFFRKKPGPAKVEQCREAATRARSNRDGLYGKGDVIAGKYEVHGVLGKGGFGIVYLVFNRETSEVAALKTFRDELLVNVAAKKAFKREALFWIKLDDHPFILAARWVAQISGRLFVQMDYVSPDGQGRVSLADHLTAAGGPLETNQVLTWSIQFCLGMEHANSHGIECHRDIKPANILIDQDGNLKVTDFGLAAAAEAAWRERNGHGATLADGDRESAFELSLIVTQGKRLCGTPGYIPPELFREEASDRRSDIYSFGLVLWQMAIGSRVPPFAVPWRDNMEGFLRGIYEQQMAGHLPEADGPFGPLIGRCLRPCASERYASFRELRADLETIWEERTRRKFEIPLLVGRTPGFWINKGSSLHTLGRHEEAIECHEKALAIDPQRADAWNGKGIALSDLGRRAQAVECYNKALEIDRRHPYAWNNKGCQLNRLGQSKEAIECYEQALMINPRYADAWNNKGLELDILGRVTEAIECFDKALAIDPRHVVAWTSKGVALHALGRTEAAIACYDNALATDPHSSNAWYNKGNVLGSIGQYESAVECYDNTLAIDRRFVKAWVNKGAYLAMCGRQQEAIACYDQALAIDPRDAFAWKNKGDSLSKLGRHAEADECFENARQLKLST